MPTRVNPIKNKEKDSVEGTCDQVNTYIQNSGVTDTSGNQHAGYAGWTHADITYSYNFEYKRTRKQIVYCNCNKKYYDDLSTCMEECKVTLGCFSGICGPADENFCLETTKVSVNFSASIVVSVVDWVQPDDSSRTCKATKSKWDKAIESHERVHVKDIQKVVSQLNKTMKKKKYFACADTEEEAKNKLDQQIAADVASENTKVRANIKELADAFHNSPAGQPILLDCSKC